MAATFAGISFQPIATGFSAVTATNGNYYDTGMGGFGGSPHVYAPRHEEQPITFPGVDGTITKRFGWRDQLITATLVIVGPYASIGSTRNSMLNTFTQQNRYTISLDDGSTLTGCKFNSMSSQVWKQGSGKSILIMNCSFLKLQPESSGS